MSSLTPCNYCSLASIRRSAEADGATVELLPAHVFDEQFFGWWAAKRSDQDKPCAWFMMVTAHCVC